MDACSTGLSEVSVHENISKLLGIVIASFPGPKRGPGTHHLRMRQSVPRFLVHRIFLRILVRYTIT